MCKDSDGVQRDVVGEKRFNVMYTEKCEYRNVVAVYDGSDRCVYCILDLWALSLSTPRSVYTSFVDVGVV